MSDPLPVITLPDSPVTPNSPSSAYNVVDGIAQPKQPVNLAPSQPTPDFNPAVEVQPQHPQPEPTPSVADIKPAEPAPVEKFDFTKSVNDALAALDDPGAAADQNKGEGEPAAKEPTPEKDGEGGEETPAARIDDGDPTADIAEFDMTSTEGWTAKAAKAFERIKSQRKQVLTENEELKAQVSQREAQLNELKGAMQVDNVEQLQTRIQEFERQQTFTNLENTRAYKEAVTKPLVERLAILDEVADRAGASGDALIDLITEAEDPNNLPEFDADGSPYVPRDVRIQQLLERAGPRDQAKVFQVMNEVDQLMGIRANLHQNAHEALQEAQLLEQKQTEIAAAESAKKRVNVTNAVIDQIVSRVPFLAEMEGLDLAKVKKDVGGVDVAALHPVDAQYYAATAKLFPVVVNDLASAQKEIEQLTAKLAEYDDSEPSAGGGSKPTTSPARGGVGYSPNQGQAPSFTDAVNQSLAKMGVGS
jgi:hypothetical protein